ncbi:MAG TPA: CBS domain-containing protein [Kofleriaceae bacterium]|jgi:CBS domain-containing protein|nr:CBS domain-containing protein [Kofleriaceae bacterium]
MEKIARTPISEVKARTPVRVHRSRPLIDAVTLLRERRRGAVIVEDDDGRLVGIFTERDLLTRVRHENHDWHTQSLEDHMTRNPRTLPPTDTIADAVRVLDEGSFRHLPIVDADGRAVGILSVRDIVRHIAEHYPKEFLNLPPDPQKEARARWGG